MVFAGAASVAAGAGSDNSGLVSSLRGRLGHRLTADELQARG